MNVDELFSPCETSENMVKCQISVYPNMKIEKDDLETINEDTDRRDSERINRPSDLFIAKFEYDVKQDNKFGQDVKQEPELDICLEEDYNEIDSEDQACPEMLECSSCPFESLRLQELKMHITEVHIEGKYCQLCDREFDCSKIKHCYTHLPANKDFNQTSKHELKCSVCAKIFKIKHKYDQHMAIHTSMRPNKCNICSKTFRTKNQLKCHAIRLHPVESEGKSDIRCEICLKVFPYNANLVCHMRTHTGEAPFKCKICSNNFRYKSCLTSHIRTQHELLETTVKNDLQCSVCSKMFAGKALLIRHMRSHTGEKPFKCEICSNSFGYKSCLTNHARTQHGILESTIKTDLQCSVCLKIVGGKALLIRHMRSHTGEKPFKCEICSKTFQTKNNLKYHGDKSHAVQSFSERNIQLRCRQTV